MIPFNPTRSAKEIPDASELRDFLDFKADQFNNRSFIEADPIQIPHRYQRREDIEISGFLTATIAWGNRKGIIQSAERMMEMLGGEPYAFVMEASAAQIGRMSRFTHRTFQGPDLPFFIKSIKNIYKKHGGFEPLLAQYSTEHELQRALHELRKVFFEPTHLPRTEKHFSDPLNQSAAKRLNMWLRWMIRRDNKGVDFGLWKSLRPAQLSCPLDVHSGNVARKLGLLIRPQNDARAVAELDMALRRFDPVDPVKYDFALFGLGAVEKF